MPGEDLATSVRIESIGLSGRYCSPTVVQLSSVRVPAEVIEIAVEGPVEDSVEGPVEFDIEDSGGYAVGNSVESTVSDPIGKIVVRAAS
ncbi:hypothetical protein VB773_22640 [Haloarculaceae archaeon H-GB2-1]|nr:hypothetical protein [Haloarculaceae archaeon H-GB2-1]